VLLAGAAGFQYSFEVHHADQLIASGRVAAIVYDL
jgi:hypothetical protein